jgi:hypothetical protein
MTAMPLEIQLVSDLMVKRRDLSDARVLPMAPSLEDGMPQVSHCREGMAACTNKKPANSAMPFLSPNRHPR